MSIPDWIAAVVTVISVDALAIALLLDRRTPRNPASWFDHQRFIEQTKAYTQPPVIAHPCSYGGDLIEYPVAAGWDEYAILATLGEIEAL